MPKALGHEPTPAVELATSPNEIVEGDILFYKQFLVWHMLDRADRWHAGTQVEGKTGNQLINAIETCWLQIHGPFVYLVVDGEKGLFSSGADMWLNRRGIKIRPHAPGQHARMLERRGALLFFVCTRVRSS